MYPFVVKIQALSWYYVLRGLFLFPKRDYHLQRCYDAKKQHDILLL